MSKQPKFEDLSEDDAVALIKEGYNLWSRDERYMPARWLVEAVQEIARRAYRQGRYAGEQARPEDRR